ncbi:hypothetical protein B005_5082 [Nocardiopsis alba ATCC BAA-2165]|uniref:Lipoprotein n=1 Tax=Nocardiopsis alba (strain ATCC BAA-2165 / BE74) TaxID=1205910 RepID=J7KZE7_NOCAA|nr:hypothetical protein B005_5082 [Nocardiopsis alba ATCC BAA-2165]
MEGDVKGIGEESSDLPPCVLGSVGCGAVSAFVTCGDGGVRV